MEKKIIFTYTKSDVLNKQIPKDDQGWYQVNLGALNAFNAHGHFYVAEGVRDLIENSDSRIGKKLREGYLEGEQEHPVYMPGMSKVDFLIRVMKIDPDRKSHHIKKIEVVDSGVPVGGGFNGNVLNLVGWVKPMGNKGHLLKESLDDPEVNTAFSVRSLTDDVYDNRGTLIKKITTLITFDWVNEPGILTANKFDSKRVSVESYNIPLTFNSEDFDRIEKYIKDNNGIGGMESNEALSVLKEIKTTSTGKQFALFSRW